MGKLTELEGWQEVIVLLEILDRSMGKNREVGDLNNIIDWFDFRDMFPALYFTENKKEQNTNLSHRSENIRECIS